MMQPADPRYGHHSGLCALPLLHSSGFGRILIQSIVNAVLMIVADIFVNQPSQVNLVEDDYLVQQFPAATPDPALRDAIETMKKSGVLTPQLMAGSSRTTCGRLVQAYRSGRGLAP